MTRKRAPGAGRPLLGEKRRLRVSFTLSPDDLEWLQSRAVSAGVSRSELLDQLITQGKFQWGAHEDTPQSRARVPLPLEKLQEFCLENHVEKLALFGSVLTENFSKKSDIDLLVEFEPSHTPSLFRMSHLEQQLSEIFGGRRIDLKTPRELNKHFRESILEGAEVVHAS